MQKKINIDQIPGVFKASVLLSAQGLEKNKVSNAQLKDQLLSNLDREIGFYKEMENVDKDESIKDACRVIINLLETTWSTIDSMEHSCRCFKTGLKRNMDRLIGQLGFREKIASCEEERALFKEAIDTMDILLEDIYYR